RLPVVREGVGADRHLLATGHQLDLAGEVVLVEHALDLVGGERGARRVVELGAADEVDREMEPVDDHPDQRQRDQDAREDQPPVLVFDQLEVRDPIAPVDRVGALQAHEAPSACCSCSMWSAPVAETKPKPRSVDRRLLRAIRNTVGRLKKYTTTRSKAVAT